MKPGTLITYFGHYGVVLRMRGEITLIQYSEFGRVVTKIVPTKLLKERK